MSMFEQVRSRLRPDLSPLRLLMLIVAVAAITAASASLVGCGGGGDSQAWKQEFTFQVREVIEATKRVGEATRLATGPLDIQRPYEIYGEEMTVAKERLEGLESAPSACAAAEEHALGEVRILSFSGQTFNQKNYTPALLRDAKARPSETVEKLERDLSEARC
jgi:hypothetical protein